MAIPAKAAIQNPKASDPCFRKNDRDMNMDMFVYQCSGSSLFGDLYKGEACQLLTYLYICCITLHGIE